MRCGYVCEAAGGQRFARGLRALLGQILGPLVGNITPRHGRLASPRLPRTHEDAPFRKDRVD